MNEVDVSPDLQNLWQSEFGDPFLALSIEVVLLRLAFAALLGAAIGFERELHASSAGLRTHMMIALAACLFAIIADEIIIRQLDSGQQLNMDPLRLIEAVTAGVAFLAAGSIITSGGRITGLTTGAGMWMAGAIGLACGTGLIPLAILASVLALIVLWFLRRLSHAIARGGNQASEENGSEQ
ncbi:MgtC/SapB transporter (plasmid) [Ketogulonicigenium vulgare Y25]|uniref:Protein MgtC n=1 Tax=Ketogulonicigenium vulgare (strain WSH-001) TaxID=759362 RepID=F9YBN3_KETVW|nr:MgtC/SapB family protein [Ketogulonicigenium vulgare]ADO44352.1 MgtC/SapB transporter [Ketogulonicigenium vulgare Y25]AEM42785.1 MgtC/SapB transporter [Ketogulonicigenium vulgare WSH-001]ALJ82775.1 magnesium transporter MgtC [Ketogulonicigenium vulgare]